MGMVTLRQVTNSIEFPKQSYRLLNFATKAEDIFIKLPVSGPQLTVC
jgi:hypothetical protein